MIQTHCGILYYNTLKNKSISLEQIIDIFKHLNHRGRDCSGIIMPISSFDTPCILKKEGLISKDNYNEIELKQLTNEVLCHNRYATSGGNTNLIKYCQPFYSKNKLGTYWIAFNGNIPNIIWNKFYINEEFVNEENDTVKLIMYINSLSNMNTVNDWNEIFKILLEEIECAYSIVIMTQEHIYFFKDRFNFKPLCYSLYTKKTDLDNNHFIITSETNILNSNYFISETINDNINVSREDNTDKYINKNTISFKFIEPGVIYDFNKKLSKVIKIRPITSRNNYKSKNGKCSFEQIYFMREESLTFSEFEKTEQDDLTNKLKRLISLSTEAVDNFVYKETIRDVRFNLGQELYLNMKNRHADLIKTLKLKNAIVCGVPHSGIAYGQGFADLSGYTYKQIIKKNVSNTELGERTFILENQEKRNLASSKKYIYDYNESDIEKPLIVIDDSIVRGTTAKKLLEDLKQIGFKIYFLSGSPPVCNECNYGVNMGKKDNLLINKKNKNELTEYYNIEFVMYNTQQSLNLIIGDCCTQCLSPDDELF
jgi:glutamine phosphoribosylpyrophosphate amidotransferase